MATNVQLQGEVLAASRQQYADGEGKNVQLNKQGAQLAALSLPVNGEVARLGSTFVGGTITPVAPVAAMPTTAAHLSLYNPSTSGKNLFVHRVGAYCAVSAAAVIQASIALHMTTVAVLSYTGTAASAGKSISGGGVPSAQVFSATTTVVNGVWHVLGGSQNFGAQTATIAMALDSGDLGGLYVVTPGMHLDAAILCSAAGSATFSTFFTWSEIAV